MKTRNTNYHAASLRLVSRQKWEANLAAEDSLIALVTMERLGFRKRSDFVRHALTRASLLDEHLAFEAVTRTADDIHDLREHMEKRQLEAGSITRIELRLAEIHAQMREALVPCQDRS